MQGWCTENVCERRWEQTWVLELGPEWELKGGIEYERLQAGIEWGVDVGSPGRVG